MDASVALAWLFNNESSVYADDVMYRLRHDEAIVPAIWPYEVANALAVALRRDRIHADELPGAVGKLLEMPLVVRIVEPAVVLETTLRMASDLSLSTYDASYLDLAVRERIPLATLDVRLREACERAGVAVIV